jgi:hypothetical protein
MKILGTVFCGILNCFEQIHHFSLIHTKIIFNYLNIVLLKGCDVPFLTLEQNPPEMFISNPGLVPKLIFRATYGLTEQ